MHRTGPAFLALIVLVAACSSSPRVAPPSSAPPSDASRYLAIADTANAAVARARRQLAADGSDLARVQADLVAIADAKQAFDDALEGLTLPSSVTDDVAALVAADAALEQVLREGATVSSVAGLAALQKKILQAGDASVRAAVVVRQRLGLPPPPR